jgi:serine/threonine protein kinase, bacterial
VIPAALLTVAVIAAAGITGYLLRPQPAAPPMQTALSFTGLYADSFVAVDTAGNLYVTQPACLACTDNPNNHNRVLKLPAGSSTPVELAFTGLAGPRAVAVDSAGNLYVADGNDRVLKLAAGASTQTVLPFTGLDIPEGVAADTGGDIYVADLGNTANHGRVVKLAAGSSTQTVLPFTGLSTTLGGVAVDSAGNRYVTDFANNRVLKLAAGASTQTVLPFTGLSGPLGVAVGTGGNLYVADTPNRRVLKLPAG